MAHFLFHTGNDINQPFINKLIAGRGDGQNLFKYLAVVIGIFAGESYRFSFDFPDNAAAEAAFTALENGSKDFEDYLEYWSGKLEYRDCI